MRIPDTVGATCCPSNFGCGDTDRSKLIRCVDGCKPKVNEVCVLGEDNVTHLVCPKAQVDVNAGVVCKFATKYLTNNGFKTSTLCKKIINGSFDFLDVPYPLDLWGPIGLVIS